jgi:hypothetical protein
LFTYINHLSCIMLLSLLLGCVSSNNATKITSVDDHIYLKLSTNKSEYNKNEYMRCTLALYSNMKNNYIISDQSKTGYSFGFNKRYLDTVNKKEDHNVFFTSLDIIPKKVGINTIGPFTMTFGNKVYVSNAIEVNVVASRFEPTQKVAVFPVSYNGSVGVPMEITLKIYNITFLKNIGFNKRQFSKIGELKTSSLKKSSTHSLKNGKLQSTTQFMIDLLPNKTGDFIISRDYFLNIPHDIPFQNAQLTIFEN